MTAGRCTRPSVNAAQMTLVSGRNSASQKTTSASSSASKSVVFRTIQRAASGQSTLTRAFNRMTSVSLSAARKSAQVMVCHVGVLTTANIDASACFYIKKCSQASEEGKCFGNTCKAQVEACNRNDVCRTASDCFIDYIQRHGNCTEKCNERCLLPLRKDRLASSLFADITSCVVPCRTEGA